MSLFQWVLDQEHICQVNATTTLTFVATWPNELNSII